MCQIHARLNKNKNYREHGVRHVVMSSTRDPKLGKFLCFCKILFHCESEVIGTLQLKSGGLLTCYLRLCFHHKCAVKALLGLITGCIKMSHDSRIKRFIICCKENLYSIHFVSSF